MRRVIADPGHPSHAGYHDRRRQRKLRVYGLTDAGYDQLLAAQGGVCAICRKAETARNRQGRIRPLAVDHDHDTGDVRGLLCANCNVGIGYFDDEPERLQAGATYLRNVARRRLRIVGGEG
ncbi:MAG: hypothetical protein EPN91_07960 [Salinibacterium sp.]|nr:MAG: hypothetical protein EPN91_07960 [Salinibacterium sp.]